MKKKMFIMALSSVICIAGVFGFYGLNNSADAQNVNNESALNSLEKLIDNSPIEKSEPVNTYEYDMQTDIELENNEKALNSLKKFKANSSIEKSEPINIYEK